MIVIILALVLWPVNLILNFNKLDFRFDTVFKNDYQGEQLVLRNIQLYPTVLTARIFQNKPRIYLTKYVGNFLTLTDPNNYFFGLHPRPLSGNVNLFKFPFLTIIFFIIGLISIFKFKFKNIALVMLTVFVLLLSTLSNFEGLDFIMWVPISLIIVHGVNIFQSAYKKAFTYFSLIYVLFAIPEIIRVFYTV